MQNPWSPQIDQLDDATATRLGLKAYNTGTVYANGITPTFVTGSITVTSVHRATLVPYQMQDGNWHLRFNISADTGSTTGGTFTLSGVTFANVSSFFQAIAVYNNTAGVAFAWTNIGVSTGNIQVNYGSASILTTLSGDCQLESKPTWAF